MQVKISRDGKSAVFISSYSLNTPICGSLSQIQQNEELNQLAFEVYTPFRGFDVPTNPENNIVKIFNSNLQQLSSNSFYGRKLSWGFYNQNIITRDATTAEKMAELLVSNDQTFHMEIIDDFGTFYFCDVILETMHKQVTEDFIEFSMVQDKFSKIQTKKDYNYSDFLDSNGNIVSNPDWQFDNTENKLQFGINSQFSTNFNNKIRITDGVRLSFKNNFNGTLREIKLFNSRESFVIDFSKSTINDNEEVIIDFLNRTLLINDVDNSHLVNFPSLKSSDYDIVFNYGRTKINLQYSVETVTSVFTISQLQEVYDYE